MVGSAWIDRAKPPSSERITVEMSHIIVRMDVIRDSCSGGTAMKTGRSSLAFLDCGEASGDGSMGGESNMRHTW